jgi:hypothetical protein
MSRARLVAGDGQSLLCGEWLEAPQRSLAACGGSRDGRCDCWMRSSIVHVGCDVPVRTARGQLGARGERGARRSCGRSLWSGMLRVTSPPALSRLGLGCRRGGAGHNTNAVGYLAGNAEQRRVWAVRLGGGGGGGKVQGQSWCCGRVAAPERVVLFLWIMLGSLASPL